MKKLLFLAMLMTLVCCGTVTYVDTTNYGQTMEKTFDKMFSATQFDSICKADTIPSSLNSWEKSPILNDETEKYEYEYFYIKSLGKNQCIYRLEPSDKSDSVRITKRITY